jgi:hypothetical protein
LLAPPLAVLTAWLAVLELCMNRVIPLSLHVLGDHRALYFLRVGPFPRNVACVAGIISLAITFYGFLRMAGWSTLMRRIQIAALSGLLFPSLLLGLLLPKDRMIAPVVLIAVGVGHAIVALLGIVVIRYHRSPTRAASLAMMITSALVLTLLVTSSLESVQRFLTTPESLAAKITWGVMAGSRLFGELVWCSVPWIALGPRLRELVREPIARGVLIASVLLALGLAGLIESTLHPNLSVLGYSAFRLTFLEESLGGFYGLFALLALALGFTACTSQRPEVRQLGAGVLLWIACGFAPRSLSQVLYFVLAAALLSRVTQGTDPEGQRRARLPWGASLEPPQIPADLAD